MSMFLFIKKKTPKRNNFSKIGYHYSVLKFFRSMQIVMICIVNFILLKRQIYLFIKFLMMNNKRINIRVRMKIISCVKSLLLTAFVTKPEVIETRHFTSFPATVRCCTCVIFISTLLSTLTNFLCNRWTYCRF